MEEKLSFEKLWGLVQIHLREDGKRSLYSEAIDVKKGEILDGEVVVFVKNEGNLLDRVESKKVIEEYLQFETLKDYKLVIRVDKSQEEKLNKLKKMFGDKLEIR